MAPIALVCCAIFGLEAGWMLKSSEENKTNMQDIDKKIGSIEEENQSRSL